MDISHVESLLKSMVFSVCLSALFPFFIILFNGLLRKKAKCCGNVQCLLHTVEAECLHFKGCFCVSMDMLLYVLLSFSNLLGPKFSLSFLSPSSPGKIVAVTFFVYLIKYSFINKINLKLVCLFILALHLFENPFMVL